jgi:cell division protein FtsZ
VSVVATGIDKPAGMIDANEQRIAEAAERMRAQAAARQAEAAISARPAPAAAPETYYVEAPVSHPAPVQAASQPQQQAPDSFIQPQVAAIYAPHHADVQIKRVQPQSQGYQEAPAAPARRVEAPLPTSFVPPAAEQPLRAPRMPNIDDLPIPGQNLIRAQQQPQAPSAPESRRRTLLERLATFGMSRAEEEHHEQKHALAPAPQIAQQPYGQPSYQTRPSAPSATHAEYAKRPQAPRPGALIDQHGRAPARPEEEQLEIPAFLRRQSN